MRADGRASEREQRNPKEEADEDERNNDRRIRNCPQIDLHTELSLPHRLTHKRPLAAAWNWMAAANTVTNMNNSKLYTTTNPHKFENWSLFLFLCASYIMLVGWWCLFFSFASFSRGALQGFRPACFFSLFCLFNFFFTRRINRNVRNITKKPKNKRAQVNIVGSHYLHPCQNCALIHSQFSCAIAIYYFGTGCFSDYYN